jgi:2-C-methyl-D-erythritol 4-phosphate cytidylyltransferase
MKKQNRPLKTQAIVPAAGKGERFKSKIAKPLVLLNGKPLVVYALQVLERSSLIDSVILVAGKNNKKDFEKMVREYRLNKVAVVVVGGETRCVSVSNGLKVLDEDTDYVLIHDGVRPFVSRDLIEDAIRLCYREDAVITAVPVKPTIKRVNLKDFFVEATLDRRFLWEVQTPQVFKKEIILKAHAGPAREEATDDAYLVEKLGVPVKILKGDYRNIKITTPDDLLIAERLLNIKGK